MGVLRRARGWTLATVVVILVTACQPTFPTQAGLTVKAVSPTSVDLIWNPAYDGDPGDGVSFYAIYVNNVYSAYVYAPATNCTLVGLTPSTNYSFVVTAVSLTGEWSGEIGGEFTHLGRLSANHTTPGGSPSGSSLSCANDSGSPDGDADGLPDWAETNTAVYVNPANTGTSPTNADTDGDAIKDGDEVLGTPGGLPLHAMGARPLRKNIFIEADWYDDTSARCGFAFSMRPTAAQVSRLTNAFATSPVANPDGSTGIDLVIDYGQGGAFFSGNLIPGSGAITGEVNNPNDATFDTVKAANFPSNRRGYFHYMVMATQYGGGTSSGVAELPGDDFIVAHPPCLNISTNGASYSNQLTNTIMHELGHNLYQWHAGVPGLSANWRPNYNSVMNHRYQGNGIDSTCDARGDNVLDYSSATRITLNEASLNEFVGVCGSGFAIDWNQSGSYSTGVAVDLDGNSLLQTYSDYNNWANIYFGGINDPDNDGLGAEQTWIVEDEIGR